MLLAEQVTSELAFSCVVGSAGAGKLNITLLVWNSLQAQPGARLLCAGAELHEGLLRGAASHCSSRLRAMKRQLDETYEAHLVHVGSQGASRFVQPWEASCARACSKVGSIASRRENLFVSA